MRSGVGASGSSGSCSGNGGGLRCTPPTLQAVSLTLAAALVLSGCEILPASITNGYHEPIELTVYRRASDHPLTAVLSPGNRFAFRAGDEIIQSIKWTTSDGTVRSAELNLAPDSRFHFVLDDHGIESRTELR